MEQVLASTIENFMQGVLHLQTPFNMVVIIVMMSVGAGVITTLITQIRKYASHRQELEFKREMLDRGLSVDEIEKIVQAKGQEQ